MVMITDIDVTVVSYPFERSVGASSYEKNIRETIVVTIETNSGVTGQTYSGDFGDVGEEGRRKTVRFIQEDLAQVFIGSELLQTDKRWEEAFNGVYDFPVWESENRWFFINAIGALDTAVWDAIGKSLGKPLYQLLGGYRDSVPAIAIGGYYEQDKGISDLVDEIKEYEQMGFTGVKMKVGKASLERDLDRLRNVREALPSEFEIACDANNAWSIDEAITFCSAAEEIGIRWIEEPVVWDKQYKGMQEVRRRTTIPVCAGQSEITAGACRRLIDTGAVDILNFDASWGGGPTIWRQIAHTASLHGVRMGHHEEPHLAMHLLAGVDNGMYVECFHPDLDPIWYQMVANRPPVEDGRIALPDDPGLGLRLDNDFIDEYSLDNA